MANARVPPQASVQPAEIASTQPCVRCGEPVALDVAMCERCNPLGLAQPAASQAHGTVFLGIVVAVLGLALLGRLALSGLGPFRANVTNVVSVPPVLEVTLTVTNDGTRGGQTDCRVFDPAPGGISSYAVVQTPRLEPGATVSFTRSVSGLGTDVRPLQVECRVP